MPWKTSAEAPFGEISRRGFGIHNIKGHERGREEMAIGDRFNHIKRVVAPTETFAPSGFDPFFIHISFHFSPFVDTRWGNQYQSERH